MKQRIIAFAVVISLSAPLGAQAPQLQQAKSLIDAHKYAEAKALLQPIGERDATAAFYLGQIFLEQNDAGRAVNWLEKAVAMNPRSSVYYDWLGKAYGTQAQTASVFRQPSLASKTRSAWEKAIALDPENLEAREDMVVFYNKAPGFMGGGKDKARAMAQEIRKRSPYQGSVVMLRLCSEAKDVACAEREARFLGASYPDSSAGYATLAAFYSSTKQFDKAFAVVEQRLKAKPQDQSALYAYGRTSSISGLNLDRGEQSLKAYIAAPLMSPPVSNAHYRLGLIEEKKGEKDLARREYQIALQLNPKYDEAKKALAASGR